MCLYIGNDIVDLQLPDNTHARLTEQRWLRKVLAATELRWLLQQPAPQRPALVWWLWSCKEAAYKVSVKCGTPPNYRPTAYVVQANEAYCSAAVHTPAGECWTQTTHCPTQYIHTIASNAAHVLGQQQLHTCIQPLRVAAELSPSQQLHSQLLQALPYAHAAHFTLQKTMPHRIPYLHYNGAAVAHTDVSLSHDGHWAALVLYDRNT